MTDHLEAVNYKLNVRENVISVCDQFLTVTKLWELRVKQYVSDRTLILKFC
jgi:hypothetical protein